MIAYGSAVFNYASKFLALFFDPFHWALLLAVGAVVSWKKPALALRLLAASIFALLVFSRPGVSLTIARSLEAQYRDADVAQMPEAAAIVVLGGTIHTLNQVHHASALVDSSDRLLVTYRLYRAGKAPLDPMTGVKTAPPMMAITIIDPPIFVLDPNPLIPSAKIVGNMRDIKKLVRKIDQSPIQPGISTPRATKTTLARL
jgi:hypothetical protein